MQLLCGQCGHVQTADDDVAGPVECAHCGHAILIPGEFDPSATVTNVEPPADEDEGFAEIARKAVPRKVRLTCHECDKRFSVSARRSGRQGRCPACGTKIDVPYPDDEVQFDLPHVEHADFDLDEEPVELIAIEEPVLESAQRADDAHHIRCGNSHIKFRPAILDFLNNFIRISNVIRSGITCSIRCIALSEHHNGHRLAKTIGHDDDITNLLVSLAGI